MVWYLSTLSVALYVAVRGFMILRAKRGYRDFENSEHTIFVIRNIIEEISISVSQSCQIRHSLWIPFHGLVLALRSLLPDGPTTLLASLFSRIVLRHLALLWHFRLVDISTSASHQVASCCCSNHLGCLEFPISESVSVW